MVGAPRSVSCARVRLARTSALCVTSVPASVTGEDAPDIAIEMTLLGMPCRADAMMTSAASLVIFSGLTGHSQK